MENTRMLALGGIRALLRFYNDLCPFLLFHAYDEERKYAGVVLGVYVSKGMAHLAIQFPAFSNYVWPLEGTAASKMYRLSWMNRAGRSPAERESRRHHKFSIRAATQLCYVSSAGEEEPLCALFPLGVRHLVQIPTTDSDVARADRSYCHIRALPRDTAIWPNDDVLRVPPNDFSGAGRPKKYRLNKATYLRLAGRPNVEAATRTACDLARVSAGVLVEFKADTVYMNAGDNEQPSDSDSDSDSDTSSSNSSSSDDSGLNGGSGSVNGGIPYGVLPPSLAEPATCAAPGSTPVSTSTVAPDQPAVYVDEGRRTVTFTFTIGMDDAISKLAGECTSAMNHLREVAPLPPMDVNAIFNDLFTPQSEGELPIVSYQGAEADYAPLPEPLPLLSPPPTSPPLSLEQHVGEMIGSPDGRPSKRQRIV